MLPTPWLPVADAAGAIPPAVLVGRSWPHRDEPVAAPSAAMLTAMIWFDLASVGTLVVRDAASTLVGCNGAVAPPRVRSHAGRRDATSGASRSPPTAHLSRPRSAP